MNELPKEQKLVQGFDCRGTCGKSWVSLDGTGFQQNDDGSYRCDCGGDILPNLVYPPETEDDREGGRMKENKCGKPATHRIFWPGRPPMFQCEEHTKQVLGLGGVLGVYIHFEPVEGSEELCSQIVPASVKEK